MAVVGSRLGIVKNSLIRSRDTEDISEDESSFSSRDTERDMKGYS